MMNEIKNNGPITCAIANSPELEFEYKGGIFKNNNEKFVDLNHVISIVGKTIRIKRK